MPVSTEGEGRRYVQPNMSDSTLSTVGATGLEELAAFVRGCSSNGWEEERREKRQEDNGRDVCQDNKTRHLDKLHSPSLAISKANDPLSGLTTLPLNHDDDGPSVLDFTSSVRKKRTTTPGGNGQSDEQKWSKASATQSIAELVVHSVTEAALQRSASKSSSILRDNTEDYKISTRPIILGINAEIVEVDAPPAREIARADEKVIARKPIVPLHTKTAAEIVVQQVTALGLETSTSSILKADRKNVSIHGTDDAQRSVARAGAKSGAENTIVGHHSPRDSTRVKVQRDAPNLCSKELLLVEREQRAADGRAAALQRATLDGSINEQSLPTCATKDPRLEDEDIRAGRGLNGTRIDGQGNGVERHGQAVKRINATDVVVGSNEGSQDDNDDSARGAVVARQRVPAPPGKLTGDKLEHRSEIDRPCAAEATKGARERRSIEAEAEPQLHQDHSRQSTCRTSSGQVKEKASGSATRVYNRSGSHREAAKLFDPQSPALVEAAASTHTGHGLPGRSEDVTAVRVSTLDAGEDFVGRATSSGGAVVGLAGLHRDVASWFNGEVLVPSAAGAVAHMSNKGGARPSSSHLSTARPAGSEVPFLDDNEGWTTILGDGNVCVAQNPTIDQTRDPCSGHLNEDVDLCSRDDDITTTGRQRRTDPEIVEAGPPRQADIGHERRPFHPAQVFRLLWQRNRYRCPFSCCPIPDTVVFDSMGEAVDWYFTSKREGGIKRKLTSNTRLSNIFQEFSKGSGEEGDPVAVFVFWTSNISQGGASPPAEITTGRRVEVSGATLTQHQKQHLERQNGSHHCDRRDHRQHQRGTVIKHFTARELHTFLFGGNRDYHKLSTGATSHASSAAGTDGSKKWQTNARFKTKRTVHHFRKTLSDNEYRAHPLARNHGGADFKWPHTETYGPRNSERSEAAARAAGEGAGDDSGGGWCLLQRFIAPAGSKVSSLRCDWTASPSRRPPRPSTSVDAHAASGITPAAGARGLPRWGSVEEVETSFRERSPARSPFRERPVEQSGIMLPENAQHRLPTSSHSAKGRAAREHGAAGRISTSERVSEGCVLQRCTNIFRADRRDLTCEDRCVTFEEPAPSSRGGLWPRSEEGPVRSSPLRQTLVEACSAISDHIHQVTKGVFRVQAATAFFRQGADGRTYLMFLSTWGESPTIGIDRFGPLLGWTTNHSLAEADVEGHEVEAQRQHKMSSLNGHTQVMEEITRRPPEPGGHGQGDGELPFRSAASISERVCPGCGCPGVRGGVRRIDGESTLCDKAPTRGRMAQRGGSQVAEGTGRNVAIERPGASAGSCENVSKTPPWLRLSSAGSAVSTRLAVVSAAFHTSLGVIADVCTSRPQPDAPYQPKVTHFQRAAWTRDSARTPPGLERCLRVLGRIYPGVPAKTIAERCNEDLRLRLREVSLCQECAVEINGASDARLKALDDAAKSRMGELAGRLGIMSGQTSLSVRQRKARVMEDIKAFRHRITSGSSASCPAETHRNRCFGGGPSRIRESSVKHSGHLPRRPLGPKCIRPRTTDGISPRQQHDHCSRKIVSATTPSIGFDGSSGSQGNVQPAAKASGPKTDEGKMNEACEEGYIFRLSRATGNKIGSGSGGGGLDDFGGFAVCSSGRLGDESRDWTSVLQEGREKCTAISRSDQHQQSQQHQQQQQPHHSQDEKGLVVFHERSFYTPASKAFRCRRLFDTYGGRERGEYGKRSSSPGRVDNQRPSQSAPLVRAPLRRHWRAVSRPTRERCSARAQCSSGTSCHGRGGGGSRCSKSDESSPTGSSKALQWAKTVSAKAVERSCSGPPPKSSRPPRRHMSNVFERGDTGPGDGDAYGPRGKSGARCRSTRKWDEMEGDSTARWLSHDGCTRVTSSGGDRDVNGALGTPTYSAAGDAISLSGADKCVGDVAAVFDGMHDGGCLSESYSDASFAVDGENDDDIFKTGECSEASPKKLECGGYADNNEVTVDGIPSMLVETGRL